MNIFRLCGDVSHQIAILLLIVQLCKAKNARGISVKMQELRLLVFVSRYLDLFTTFYSLYNSVVKVIYIVSTGGIIYAIKYKEPIKSIYNYEQDSFPHWKYCAAPAAVLACIVHYVGSGWGNFHLMELCWTFSILLEPLAILPQLHVLRKYRLVENLTGKFVFFLGLYRFLYILNWIYRSQTERRYRHHWVVYISGVVQTLLYLDFYYQYLKGTRCCGYARGKFFEDYCGVEDEEDENRLVYEMAVERDVSRSEALQSTIEPLMGNATTTTTIDKASDNVDNDYPMTFRIFLMEFFKASDNVDVDVEAESNQ